MRAILHFDAPQTGQMGCLEGANCKIAGPVAAASLPSSAPPCPLASIMNLAALGVRYVAANLMINPVAGARGGFFEGDKGVCVLVGAGKSRKLLDHGAQSEVSGWAGRVWSVVCGLSGSGVVGGTLVAESLAGAGRCNR